MGYKNFSKEQLEDLLQRILDARKKTERNISEGKGDRTKLYGFLGELKGEEIRVLEEMRRRQ
ncbi:hypothetical protein PMV_401 [Port-miou virus]|uniref:Uncharacterized protein n=1 Tax=Port-miou virus TaxID=1733873 RepID=A0A0N9PVZ0_9VIRU|nr:hypothetical protein PMV_401 [Port-miou virus]